MRFILTPHVKAILCGRGMCDGDRLLCEAEKCLYREEESPDPKFGRDIEVEGEGICSRCKANTLWSEGKEFSDQLRRTILKCKVCKMVIPRKSIIWTQEVISKHRRTRHRYFHKECYEATFIGGDEEEDEEALWSGISNKYEKRIIKFIKWAERCDR